MDRRKTDRRREGADALYVLDIQTLLETLWRRKAIVIGLMLIVLIPGFLFALTKPNKYTATTSVILEEKSFDMADFKDALPSQTFNEMTVDTQTNLLKSPMLAQLTIERLEKEGVKNPAPRDKAVQEFLKNILVDSSAKSRVIKVSYRSKDPVLAAKMVNAHVATLIDYQMESKKEKIGAISEWLTQQIEALKKDSQTKAQEMQAFRTESGIVPGKNSQELIYQQISDLTEQLVPIETEKLSLQARSEAMKAAGSKEGVPALLESQVIKDLKAQASQARQELKALGAQFGTNHPDYQAAQKRVNQVNADLGRETANIKNSIGMELEAITKQEELLRSRIDELNRQTDELRDKEVAMEAFEAGQDANMKLLSTYLEQHEQIKTQLNFTSPDIRVIANADAPTQPTGTRKIVLLILIGLFAAAFAVGTTLLLELIDRGIEQPDDIKKILNLKLIGILPKTRNPLSEINPGSRGVYVEEIKRIYLALAAGNKGPQAILITAAKSGEGKSTIAFTFARYLHSIGVKVVLVDANTTSPSVALLSGTNQGPGFSELITGTVEAAKCIHKDDTGLSVIPAGNTTGHLDLLAGDRLAKAIAALKSQYDFVVLDCAPALSTTDAEVIARQVDQVVLVIERARTAKKYLKTVAETLRQHANDTPAVIFNKAV